MRVLFFTEGFTPATRFRVLQYLPHLARRGIQGTVRYFRDAAFPLGGVGGAARYPLAARDVARRLCDVLGASRYDAICFQRDLVPWNTDVLERLASRLNRRVVFDFDDAIYLSASGEGQRERKIRNILRRTRIATVANRTLADFAARWAETVVLPMAVDTDGLTVSRRNGGPVRIGWIGTPTNYRFLGLIREALREVAAQPDVELVAMSGSRMIPELEGIAVRMVPWSETGELELLSSLDVGLVPLAETPWTQGKFPIKLLQYMAAGAVPVCSPVGVISEVIADGVNGLVARDAEGWRQALIRLIEDPLLRRRLGDGARQTVEQRYSVRTVAPAMADVFERVAA